MVLYVNCNVSIRQHQPSVNVQSINFYLKTDVTLIERERESHVTNHIIYREIKQKYGKCKFNSAHATITI